MPQFHRLYDSGREYTIQELKARLTLTECQADRLAAAILMPRFTVMQALQEYNNGQKVKVYGQAVYANEDRKVIRKMAAQAGVSFAALQIRLQELDLLEFHPLGEYVNERILG